MGAPLPLPPTSTPTSREPQSARWSWREGPSQKERYWGPSPGQAGVWAAGVGLGLGVHLPGHQGQGCRGQGLGSALHRELPPCRGVVGVSGEQTRGHGRTNLQGARSGSGQFTPRSALERGGRGDPLGVGHRAAREQRSRLALGVAHLRGALRTSGTPTGSHGGRREVTGSTDRATSGCRQAVISTHPGHLPEPISRKDWTSHQGVTMSLGQG